MVRAGAPGHARGKGAGVETDFAVEHGLVIAAQLPPLRHSRIPLRALRHPGTALQVVEQALIRRHDGPTCSGLHAHVAQRQTAFDAHRPNRLTGVFDHVARGAIGTDQCDQAEHQIFRRDAGLQLAVHRDTQVFLGAVNQGLGGQQVFYLAAPNAKAQSPHGSVRRGVAVASGHHHARQDPALLAGHHVLDALAGVQHVEQLNAVACTVLGQCAHLSGAVCIDQHHGAGVAHGRGGVDMVHHRQRGGRPPHRTPLRMQGRKCLRAGVFIKNLSVDVQQNLPAVAQLPHRVRSHDALVQGPACHGLGVTAAVPAA